MYEYGFEGVCKLNNLLSLNTLVLGLQDKLN